MLPHVRDRPLSLQVFPGGIKRPGHFLKQIPDYFPDWIDRVEMPKHGGTVTHAVANRPDDAAACSPSTTRSPRTSRPRASTSPTGRTG